MAELHINATRSELLKLKRRIKLAKRGHKLLKEKRDGLMRSFMELVREYKLRYKNLEVMMDKAISRMIVARVQMKEDSLENLLILQPNFVKLEVKKYYSMNISVPALNLTGQEDVASYAHGFYDVPIEVDQAFSDFSDILADVVKLAEIEKRIKLLAPEVEKTRRRVNALEHVIIPRFESAARDIKMKLDEMERSSFTTLLRLKETTIK